MRFPSNRRSPGRDRRNGARTRWALALLALAVPPGCGGSGGSGDGSITQRLATTAQPVHAAAVEALETRAPDAPIAVLRLLQLRDGGREALGRLEERMARLREQHGGRLVASTTVRGVLVGEHAYDEVRITAFPTTAAYLDLLADDAYVEVAGAERDALERKVVLFGSGALLPRASGDFANPAFRGLDRTAAEALIAENVEGDGEGDREVIVRMLVEDLPGEFFMLNLLDLREGLAVYPNGEYPDSTGAEANERYNSVVGREMRERNSGPRHLLAVEGVLVGDRPGWNLVATVRYASTDALVDMVFDPDLQANLVHKFAALEATEVFYTRGDVE